MVGTECLAFEVIASTGLLIERSISQKERVVIAIYYSSDFRLRLPTPANSKSLFI